MNGGAATSADGVAFDEWLSRVSLDDPREDGTKSGAGAPPPPLESVPAVYIRRAVLGHLENRRNIRSGIEARNMRFTGDLHLDNLRIDFPLYLLGCTFEGAVFGSGIKSRTLSFTNSVLCKGANLRNAEVDGHLFLRGAFEAHGPLLLRDMRITGTLDLRGGRFLYDGAPADDPFEQGAFGESLSLSRAEATALLWAADPPETTAKHREEVAGLAPRKIVNLRDFKVRAFSHDLATAGLRGWPGKCQLIVDGFRYDRVDQASRETFLDWLALQKERSPEPYFQLASVLQAQGRKDDATAVRSRVRRNEVDAYGQPKRLFFRLFFWPVDYGASPVRALGLMVTLLGIYWAAVAGLEAGRLMEPASPGRLFNPCYYAHPTCREDLSKWRQVTVAGARHITRYVPPDYPRLSTVQYSVEAFVPFVDFGQRDHWEPASGWARFLLAVGALFGIFFGSLFFAAVTGLMRPRES
ncbi:MAG TPA: hypothetical protein VF650_16340 [Allosphingosinicella sp.]|jgi:hypothetical protein